MASKYTAKRAAKNKLKRQLEQQKKDGQEQQAEPKKMYEKHLDSAGNVIRIVEIK